MSYERKTWTDRVSEYPRRRLLVPDGGGDGAYYTVSRAEGNVIKDGDPFSAGVMNAFEGRIESEFDIVETDLSTNKQTGDTADGQIEKGAYFLRSGEFYKAKALIANGAGFNSNNCEATSVGKELKTLADTFANMDTWINNSLASLNTGMQDTQRIVNTGFAQRPKCKFITFTGFHIDNGIITGLRFDCRDVLASRAWALTVTPEYNGTETFDGILTRVNPDSVTFSIRCTSNHSWSGDIDRLNVLVWGY